MKIRKNNGNYKTSLVPYTNINNENIYEVLKFSHSYIYLFFTILQERSILQQNKGSKSSYKGNLFV